MYIVLCDFFDQDKKNNIFIIWKSDSFVDLIYHNVTAKITRIPNLEPNLKPNPNPESRIESYFSLWPNPNPEPNLIFEFDRIRIPNRILFFNLTESESRTESYFSIWPNPNPEPNLIFQNHRIRIPNRI